MVSPLFLPKFAISPSYVHLIHLSFLSLWKIFSPLWKIFAFDPYLTCFDPNFSPFEIESPKKALQEQYAQREKLVA